MKKVSEKELNKVTGGIIPIITSKDVIEKNPQEEKNKIAKIVRP